MSRAWWLALLALLSAPVAAGELAGVSLPDRIVIGEQALVLNGMGVSRATVFRIDVYVVGLYVEEASSDAGAILATERPKRIVMTFVRDVGRKDVVNGWHESFEENAERNLAALADRIALLDSWTPDMPRGGIFSFTYEPGRGTLVEVNGQMRGTIPGADFARVLLSFWLGPHPPSAALRAALLGKG